MSWRDVPFPISHLTPVAGRLPLKREISTHWQAGCFFLMYDSITFMYDKP